MIKDFFLLLAFIYLLKKYKNFPKILFLESKMTFITQIIFHGYNFYVFTRIWLNIGRKKLSIFVWCKCLKQKIKGLHEHVPVNFPIGHCCCSIIPKGGYAPFALLRTIMMIMTNNVFPKEQQRWLK